ncbi:MAG: flagellar biosynthetic protein FliO [Nitrospinae bacterium]|nr:flagellar biosynthetic protein FliO [Nitrospinota bacterium]
MKKIAVFLTLLAGLLAGAIPEAAAAPNAFKDIASFTAGDQFRVALAFDANPKPIVKYYEKSIQIDVPGGFVKPAQRQFSVDHAGIKEIDLYQISPSLLRIRIFPQESVAALKKNFSLETNAEKLVFVVGPKAAPVPETLTVAPAEASKNPAMNELAPATDVKAPEADVASAAAASAHEESAAENAAPMAAEDAALIARLQTTLDQLKAESEPGKGKNDGGVKMAGMLPGPDKAALPQAPSLGEAFVKIGSALAVVLALILVISYGAKKYLGAMEGGFGGKKQLKVLSSHFIGVKKNVTIIEVGGEVLVLGVTNSNINLLARYSEPEKIEEIKFAHRLPDKPMGVFKKFPFMAWLERRRNAQKPVNPAFARQIASYEETVRTTAAAEAAEGNGIQTRKDEMVSDVARSIASKLRTLQGQAG